MTTTDARPNTPPTLPSWQTAPCPPWCTWSPHREDEHPEDRRHAGTTYRRALPLERPCEMETGRYEPEYVGVYLWHHVREIEPTVMMCKGESREGFHLTLEDAEVLAGLLEGVVVEARKAAAEEVPQADAGDHFVVPRKVEQGVEHPQWCEVRRHCTVSELTPTLGSSGWHRDDPERLRGNDDDRLEFEVSAAAFHDTDGAIGRPAVAVRVVEADMVDAFVEGTLLPDEARALAGLLLKAADRADSLGRHYA